MVNYHTSTLLESSEHVFGLIRYIFFGVLHPNVIEYLGIPRYLGSYRYMEVEQIGKWKSGQTNPRAGHARRAG